MRRVAQQFWDLFSISLFIVGGGNANLADADSVFAKKGITKEGEIVDRLPVFQMVPGLIATHVAVFVGRRVAGALGAAVGVVAVAIPSVVIFSFVAAGYNFIPLGSTVVAIVFVAMRLVLAGVIAATLVRSWRRTFKDGFAYAVLAASLAALVCGVAVPWVLLAAMGAGVASMFVRSEEGSSPRNARRFCSTWLPLLLFLKYGALCFGGGFVLVPMYLEDFVGPSAPFLNVTAEEFANVMSLTQVTPGPIGVNGATFFGFRLAGFAGAALASAALLLPGSLMSYFVLGSLDRFQSSRIACGVFRGAKPASCALLIVALYAFVLSAVEGVLLRLRS